MKRTVERRRPFCGRNIGLLAALAFSTALAADPEPTSGPAANPASDALNQTSQAMAASRPVSGLLSRERPRASQLIGARIYGAQGEALGEALGEIVEILLRDDGAMAVVQGGGLNRHLVAVAASDLRWAHQRLLWPGMTAATLRSQPEIELPR
ncbi:MAG: hypothetical protein H7345_19660 [Rubritepida sp.]|nr:hypothetical protein [Rubritepida sp.]